MARVWNTNASINMPTPVINQPIRVAPALALAAMFWGREKIPPPTMEPTTRAINAPTFNLSLPVATWVSLWGGKSLSILLVVSTI
ncbi:hypothetical protein D3C80_2060870 [compost metagenome]